LMVALRYWEQQYNFTGARAFLMVIAALAVFARIIPNYTKTAPDPQPGALQSASVRRHPRLLLHRLSHHPDDAAPRVLCGAQGQWPARDVRRGA
jgi:hypothetical protein